MLQQNNFALLNYPIVVSKQAAKKRISGEFDLILNFFIYFFH
ncbi:hypothetical protein [Shigella flexneri]